MLTTIAISVNPVTNNKNHVSKIRLTIKSIKMSRVQKRSPNPEQVKMAFYTKFLSIILFLIFVSTFYLTVSFTPLTKEQHIENYEKINEYVEPFRKNLSECAHQVKATMVDVENFMKRIPQSSMQGKCLVACILKRNLLITNNKINITNLLDANKAIYGKDSEVMERLNKAVKECSRAIDGIFEICEFASVFNDCMHMKMEHVLDKVTMERRMEALGQLTDDPEQWTEDEDEILKIVKDEL